MAHLIEVRRPVMLFSLAMERKLREHDGVLGETGWRESSDVRRKVRVAALMARLRTKVDQLDEALYDGDLTDIHDMAASVGNFAMMIADLRGVLR